LNITGESASISAVLDKNDTKALVGVAVLGTAADPEARNFATRILGVSRTAIPMMENHDMPFLRDIGGGTNRLRTPNAPLTCETLFPPARAS